jgi:opacity protein-like surface antigen
MFNFKTQTRIIDNRHICLCLLMVAAACASQVTFAADDLIEQWYLQPRLSLGAPDSTQSTINHQTISIGEALDKRINLEINLLSDNTDYGADNKGILIDGRYYLKSYGQFSPYIAGGISSIRNYNSLDTSFQVPTTNFGLGFEHTLKGNGAKIQADIRYFMDDKQANTLNDNNINDWTLRFGVSIPLTNDLFK